MSGAAAGERRVFIAGLGLMGASAGLALKATGGWRVSGWDTSETARRAALEIGAVDEVAVDLTAGAAGADLILLATPIRAILDHVQALSDAEPGGEPVVIDVGSTKRRICRAMDGLPDGWQAIGGHPMTGRATAGVPGPHPDLYKTRPFVLCPTAKTGEKARAIAARFVDAIGARPIPLEAEAHDRAVAYISHTPHFMAAPLLLATDAPGDEASWSLAAGGFRAATLAAADNPVMWRDIAATNADFIAEALRATAREMTALADALSADPDSAEHRLNEAARLFEARIASK